MNILRVSVAASAFCLLRTVPTWAQADFAKLPVAADSSYGYQPTNPIKLRKGDMGKSLANSVAYLSGLRTLDNQVLRKVARITVKDLAYSKPALQLTVRATGLPASGKLGLLDRYVFVTSTKQDTVVLYVDLYNRGVLALPVGLKYQQGLE